MGISRYTVIPKTLKVGRWYGPAGSASVTTLALTLDRLYLAPFELWTSTQFDGWGIGVTGGGTTGAVVRFGFYPDANGDPDLTAAPIEEQTVTTTSAGARMTFFTVRPAGPGKLWLGAVAQVATCTARSVVAGVNSNIGSTDPNDLGVFRYKDGVTGALPSPLTSLTGNIGVGPIPMLRIA